MPEGVQSIETRPVSVHTPAVEVKTLVVSESA